MTSFFLDEPILIIDPNELSTLIGGCIDGVVNVYGNRVGAMLISPKGIIQWL